MKKQTSHALMSCLLLFSLAACQHTHKNISESNSTEHTAAAQQAIPSPDQMSVDLKVKGRVSKLLQIDVKHVGKNIPYTYSDGKIQNSKDYEWWVSKHFALKSDLPEDKIRLYLELLEMSYPHYVELFGAEPANIERQRIAVVYGSSRDKVKEAMFDDGFRRGVHANAGGETMYYNRAGYSFPSHREQHQRYIVIHETMHAFHMALTGHSTWAPNWITEGLADAIAHHVYDPELNQLAVMVFDRAPMNYVETGLKQYAESSRPNISDINDNPALKRGLNFFIVHFLLSDPERAQYFALFRDKLMHVNPHSENTLPTANKLLKQTFPNWDELEQAFADYVDNISSSFHITRGPWEQDGNDYWLRSKYNAEMSRLDIDLKLGDMATSNKHRFDFPGPQTSPLIDPAQRGPEPQIGLLINYVPEQINRGEVGLLLGIQLSEKNNQFRKHFVGQEQPEDDSYLEVLLEENTKLSVSGHNLTAIQKDFPLKQEIQQEVALQHQLGLNIKLKQNLLFITLKTANQKQTFPIPVSNQVRETLMQGTLALVANNNNHQLRPYFDAGRNVSPSLNRNTTNPWRLQHADKLRLAFNYCNNKNRQGANCQSELDEIYNLMKQGFIDQADMKIGRFYSQLWSEAKSQEELTKLSGFTTQVAFDQSRPFLRVYNPKKHEVAFKANITQYVKQGVVTSTEELKTALKPGVNNLAITLAANATTLDINSQIRLDRSFNLVLNGVNTEPFDGVSMKTAYQFENNKLKVSAIITGPYSGHSKGKLRFELLPSHISQDHKSIIDVSFQPYSTNLYQHEFLDFAGNASPRSLRIIADLVVDGEDIQLSEQHFVN